MQSRPLDTTREQFRALALVAPVILYDVGLQVARVVSGYGEIVLRPDRMQALDWLGLLTSTLLFHAGFAGLSMAALCASARRPLHRLATGSMLALALAVVTIETAAHVYFLHTGWSLDFSQTMYSATRPRDLLLVVRVVEPAQWAGLVLVALLILLSPFAARRFAPAGRPPRLRVSLARALLGLGLAGLGLLPFSAAAVDRALVRDPVLNLLATSDAGGAPAAQPSPRRPELAIERDPGAGPRRNLVVVLLESARAISVKPYAARETTPFFAELAKKSLLATRARAVMPATSKALVATLCGTEPAHSVRSLSLAAGLLGRCLPALLAEQAYATAFFQSADPRFAARVDTTRQMGFRDFFAIDTMATEGFERANFLGYEDEIMLGPSEGWLRANRGKPLFATYLTVAAHHECFPLSRHGTAELSPDPEVNRYENNLRAEDFFLRGLYAQYARLGLLDSTIFVVLGDHGEGFGEHGRRTHNDDPYEEALRVPLLLHDPTGQLIPPGRFEPSVNQLDVVPTVLSLLGYRVSRGRLPGVDLFHAPALRPMMAACVDEKACLVEVRGDDKLIHHFGHEPDQLFDLRADPGEERNLASQKPALAAALLREVLTWDLRVRSRFWGESPAAARGN